MASWLTLDEARGLWRDAPADDATLGLYLESARIAVIAYAPPLDPEDMEPDPEADPEDEDPEMVQTVPENYRLGQLMQARNTFNAGKVSPSGDFDGSAFGISTMPLDWQVKQLLRPQRGMGAIV